MRRSIRRNRRGGWSSGWRNCSARRRRGAGRVGRCSRDERVWDRLGWMRVDPEGAAVRGWGGGGWGGGAGGCGGGGGGGRGGGGGGGGGGIGAVGSDDPGPLGRRMIGWIA